MPHGDGKPRPPRGFFVLLDVLQFHSIVSLIPIENRSVPMSDDAATATSINHINLYRKPGDQTSRIITLLSAEEQRFLSGEFPGSPSSCERIPVTEELLEAIKECLVDGQDSELLSGLKEAVEFRINYINT